jgi:hypothetical protein
MLALARQPTVALPWPCSHSVPQCSLQWPGRASQSSNKARKAQLQLQTSPDMCPIPHWHCSLLPDGIGTAAFRTPVRVRAPHSAQNSHLVSSQAQGGRPYLRIKLAVKLLDPEQPHPASVQQQLGGLAGIQPQPLLQITAAKQHFIKRGCTRPRHQPTGMLQKATAAGDLQHM